MTMNANVAAPANLEQFLQKHAKEPVTFQALHEVIDVVFNELKQNRDEIQSLKVEVKSLKADHEVLAEKALKGGLPWARGTSYAVQDVVQHDGSLWKCVGSHVSTESFSHEHFLLQIKRGRDGKDAR